jgi:hypothetical protein
MIGSNGFKKSNQVNVYIYSATFIYCFPRDHQKKIINARGEKKSCRKALNAPGT